MTISMYQALIPVSIRTLNNLTNILEKGAAYAETKKIDPNVLINSRLSPDMFPLSKQVLHPCRNLIISFSIFWSRG